MSGASIFAYSDQGCRLAKKVSEFLPDSKIYSIGKYAEKYNINVIDSFGELFDNSDSLIFICACGIAVRTIAPCLKSKTTDPAVVVIDDAATYVIPLLSGHIGGANGLAGLLAEKLDAIPVITTATDVNNRFAVDLWAVKNNCHISDMKLAKDISAEILISCVNMKSDFVINGKLPNGVILNSSGDLGFYISYRNDEPFTNTLKLIPKILHIGIGCRKGKTFQEIAEFFHKVTADININAVKSVSSIDIKKEEAGLLEFAEKYKLPINFYTSEELSALEGEFTSSDFVKNITGVDNVCERAAYKSANEGEFLIRKTTDNGITLAVCVEEWSVNFE
jgi:Cobalamin biosynthesis protein CbiG